jgi:uncharacterized protein
MSISREAGSGQVVRPRGSSCKSLKLAGKLADTGEMTMVAAPDSLADPVLGEAFDLAVLELEHVAEPCTSGILAILGPGNSDAIRAGTADTQRTQATVARAEVAQIELADIEAGAVAGAGAGVVPGLTIRDMGFAYPDDFDPRWNPRVPEFAMVANAVSLLMPHAEPYVVSSSRAALKQMGDDPLDPTNLANRTRAYIHQEAQHHAEHRRFNNVVARRYRTKLLERMMAATFRFLKGRSSSFGIAFAAGFETVAFVVARWVDARMHTLLPEIGKLGVDGLANDDDANVAANLFVWHLAEEAEHRSIAYEVHQRTGGTQLAYTMAMIVSFVILGVFTSLGILTMLIRDRRILHPMAWFRLIGWTLSFLFNAVPLMAVTCLSGHEPADLLDPPNLMAWLRTHDGSQGLASASR